MHQFNGSERRSSKRTRALKPEQSGDRGHFSEESGGIFPIHRFTVAALSAVFLLSGSVTVHAQLSEQKPIRLVVPYPPGGAADGVARILGIALQERLKRTVIVDNKPGASTIVGAEYVARSAPDGNTLLLTTESTLATNPSLYPKLPYAPSDFSPISLVVDMPMVLVAGTNVKASNITQVIETARRAPSESTYASIGSGSPQHLSMELLQRMAGVKMTHVPYRGGGPAMSDVAGGQVEYFFAAISVDMDEATRLRNDLGETNRAMILRNHGLLTCGRDTSDALTLMRYLVTACEIQLSLLATGCKPSLASSPPWSWTWSKKLPACAS